MKLSSSTALAIALALGVPAGVATAQKPPKGAPTAASYNLTNSVREALAAAQKAMAAGDNATAETRIAEARAGAKTDDDRYLSAQLLFELSRKTNSATQQSEALDGMLATTRLPAAQRVQLLVIVGQRAFQAGDYAKAERVLSEAIQADPTNTDAYALLAETRVKAGKPGDAIAVFQKAMDQARQTGTKLPAEWYSRAVAIAYTAKLPQAESITQEWVATYPTKDSWRDSLTIWRDLHPTDPETELDLMRLMRSAGALKGAGDYMEYANATYLRNPGEAKAVIDEGVRAGFLNLTSNANAREISSLVTPKIASDKAALASSEAQATGPKGTGRIALNVGDGYLGYENWAKAIAMYRLALSKGGVDANLINTRLGMALARSGDKAGARAAFAAVTGHRASIAKFWTIWLDQQPA